MWCVLSVVFLGLITLIGNVHCADRPDLSQVFPADRKLKIATVEIPFLYNKNNTGFIPELLRLLATYGNLEMDLQDIQFYPSFDEAYKAISNRSRDILAGGVEPDGIYKGGLNFTLPIYGSLVMQVKSAKFPSITTVSVLDSTPTQQTVAAQPGNFPGMGTHMGPPQGENSQPSTLDGALKSVEDGKTTLLGRTPVLESGIRPKPTLFLANMSTPLTLYSGFAVGNAPGLLQRLNDAILSIRTNKATARLFCAKFPWSSYIEPPSQMIPDFNNNQQMINATELNKIQPNVTKCALAGHTVLYTGARAVSLLDFTF